MGERLRIALPAGQLESDVLNFSKTLGLELDMVDKKYLIVVRNMPIDFVILRASDIPSYVFDERSAVKAGITGSDIIWEAGLGKNAGEKLPINRTDAPTPALFIGITEDFAQKIRQDLQREPTVTDLSGQIVATKFPRITTEIMHERKVTDASIMKVPGKTEAMQYVYWNCFGLVDVAESGRTRAINRIEELERFYEVTVRMIMSEQKLSPQERNILDDLREKIYLKIQAEAATAAKSA